uniref:Dipeptidase n=1 Tax=Musca domestica TaxID=7370 RepID=A0A1I8M0Q7_MUSDO
MDLRPLTYEEMCQMELMHAGTTCGAVGLNPTQTSSVSLTPVSNAVATSATAAAAGAGATTTTTMLPIMVIPTAMMPAPTNLADGNDPPPPHAHFYQLQPTHILATATPANTEFTLGSTPTTALLLQPAAAGGSAASGNCFPEQHPQQQIPQSSSQQQQQMLNILYTGTLKPSMKQNFFHDAAAAAGNNSAMECATLPRNFQPNPLLSSKVMQQQQQDESDFEGSECGASVSTTTCIPHFRFGGCGVILQPAQNLNAAASSAPANAMTAEPPQVIGCASLSHMMGTFASAAGDAMHTGGRNFMSGTLGRNRRGQSTATASSAGNHTTDQVTQTPKRVSFKGVDLPPPSPEELQMLDAGAVSQHNMDAFNNCSYMNFDHFMDYQTTGFGGLPDVTEHSNIRRNISRQNSTSNSDSGGEIASIQKSKVNFNDTKSPSDVGDPLAGDVTTAAAKAAKRKSKASQQHGHGMVGGGQHKLTGRNSCVIGLTLVVALSLLAVAATLLYQHFVMAPSRNSHTQRLKIVKRILRDVPLVDGHNNFAWNVRKYAHSSLELVHVSNDINHKSMWVRPAWAQTDMERLKMGQVGVQVWSAYVPCEAQGLDAVQLALEQIDIIRRLTDMYHQDTVLVQSSKDIQMAQRQGLISSLIGIEGGHAIGSSLGVLRSFYSLGARYLSLTHKCDVSWAGSSSTAIDAGLSQFGKAIIREMNRLGMMIDLSYSSDNTARDVLSATRAPVIFSHSGARQLCNSTRNVPDDILRLVAENGGLVMVSFDSEDVACGRQSRLKDVVDHIKYIRTIAGIQHIGLGAGYDGIELPPIGLEDVSKYPDLLATLLEDPNWSEEDIAMLAGKNFLRIMETVENVRDYWKRAAIQPIEQTEPQPKSQCAYMAS